MVALYDNLNNINNEQAPTLNAIKPYLLTESEKAKLKESIINLSEQFKEAIISGDKDYLRELHIASKNFVSGHSYLNIWKLYNKYSKRFINGKKLSPKKIKVSLKFVEAKSEWDDIFKLVRYTWSMPYSRGYGRRMRFVVYDEYHESVIGILGFQSPPVDLACRDSLFQYPSGNKMSFINRTMDAYTVGAIPPYSNILGGKLVAGLISCDEVRHAYWRIYGGKYSIMQGEKIQQPLVAVTTTSAFGRSSIYNRLYYKNRLLAEPIGYTQGYGTVHLEKVYPEIVKLLRAETADFTTGGYGVGPKIRWQHFTKALTFLKIPHSYFNHGLKREVFLFRFLDGLEEGMSGGKFGRLLNLSVSEYSDFWMERWALPRSKREESWKEFLIDPYFKKALNQI
jgi:hypothetical protein